MIFSDNGDMELRPLFWAKDTWTHLDGSSTFPGFWDVTGGTCGFLYSATYAAGLACHAGKTVTDVFVVTDSAWKYPSGYTHYIDNISYGAALVTSPEETGCHEGDGDGQFHGDKGDGDFHFDSDGCLDGDQDQIDSNNRGDGHDFHSTRIDSIAVDSPTNTVTIAGAGTSNGSPVTFTLVAVQSTCWLRGGSVSLSAMAMATPAHF